MNLIDPDELLLGPGAAKYLGISERRIFALRKEGSIGRKIAGFWMYTKTELDHYRATRQGKGGRPRKKGATHDQTPDHGRDTEQGNANNDETKGENRGEA